MGYKQLNHLSSKVFIALIAIALFSCDGGKKGDNNTTEDTTKNEVKENLQKVISAIPEPTEIPYQLKATGADFDEKLPNPPNQAEKYKTTNNKAALNLGVYATDVGYVSVYEKVQNAIDYIKAVKDLGDKIGVSNAFDPKLEQRFKDNLSKVDSLTRIISEALKNSDKYLKDNERNSIAAMIFAGSFIEGLYISTQLVMNYPKDILPTDARIQVLIPLVRLILKQDKGLNNLVDALKALDKEEDVTKLISDLEALQKLYKELNIEEKIQNNQGDLILTDQTLTGINTKIKEIRSAIVN